MADSEMTNSSGTNWPYDVSLHATDCTDHRDFAFNLAIFGQRAGSHRILKASNARCCSFISRQFRIVFWSRFGLSESSRSGTSESLELTDGWCFPVSRWVYTNNAAGAHTSKPHDQLLPIG